MFTQLNPPIPLKVLDKGDGMAFAVIDYGAEHNLLWVTAIDATGEIWCAPNPKVRMQTNWSLGRLTPDGNKADPQVTPELKAI
ncbi:MAG: hypothetical protein COA41_07870 [Sphingopyxis sp.]|nr:MAG: hypothetical protein COA41_07870 [Sphingopyxis sp.]